VRSCRRARTEVLWGLIPRGNQAARAHQQRPKIVL
jgi:hypothetical protein